MVCLELLVFRVQLDHPDGRETREHQEVLEPRDSWEPLVHLEDLDLTDFPVHQVSQEPQVTLEAVVCLVFQEPLVFQDPQVVQDQLQLDITVQ